MISPEQRFLLDLLNNSRRNIARVNNKKRKTMQNQNQNLPEEGRDVVFKLSSGYIFCGLFSAGKFLSVDPKKNIIPFKKEFVITWAYAVDAFEAFEQQKQPEQ